MTEFELKLRSLALLRPSVRYVGRVLAQRPKRGFTSLPAFFRRPLWLATAAAASVLLVVAIWIVSQVATGGPRWQRSAGRPAKEPLAGAGVSSKPASGTARSADAAGISRGHTDFSEGLAGAVSEKGKVGYIDVSGKWVIPPRFDWCGKFRQGIAWVGEGPWQTRSFFFIDRDGKKVNIPLKDAKGRGIRIFGPFSEGLAVIQAGRKYGYIDRNGKVVIAPEYDEARAFSEGLGCVSKPGGTRYIDRTGRVVIAPNRLSGTSFHEGLAGAARFGTHKWGYIDRSGKFAIRPQFDDVPYRFSEGLAAVKVGRRYGYIDRRGTMLIPPRFRHARYFSEGLAAVDVGKVGEPDDLGRRCGYIDRTGRFIIKPRFQAAWEFSEGLAYVYVGERRHGYIDHTGQFVIRLGRWK